MDSSAQKENEPPPAQHPALVRSKKRDAKSHHHQPHQKKQRCRPAAALQPYVQWLAAEEKRRPPSKPTAAANDAVVPKQEGSSAPKAAAAAVASAPKAKPALRRKEGKPAERSAEHKAARTAVSGSEKRSNSNIISRCESTCQQIRHAATRTETSANLIAETLQHVSATASAAPPKPVLSRPVAAAATINVQHWRQVAHFTHLLNNDEDSWDDKEDEVSRSSSGR